jgi:hypothetical protein
MVNGQWSMVNGQRGDNVAKANARICNLQSAIRNHTLVAMLLLLLTACGGPSTIAERRQVDGLTVALERPTQIEILQSYDLLVTLTDASGQPIDGASVYFDLDMPTMPMDNNHPIAEPLGGGRYQAKALFTMEGEWRTTVRAKVAGKEHAAEFRQQVRLPK